MTPTKFNIKLYTDREIVNFGTFSAEVKETILTPYADGNCRWQHEGEWYCFSPKEVVIEEAKAKILTKIIEYCEEGACASSYHRTILGIVCADTNIDDVIAKDVADNKYIKNGKGEWWNGKSYGWELYSYNVTEVLILLVLLLLLFLLLNFILLTFELLVPWVIVGIAIIATTIFFNLSNHRISDWSDEQLTAASKFGTIIDVEFPNVNPHANEEEVMELAEDKFHEILQKSMEQGLDVLNLADCDITIHCMGEHAFVWYFNSLVRRYSDSIHIVVSTTERNVVETTIDGVTTKVVKFKFVRFREII